MNNVKSIRLNRKSGEVACFQETTEIFTIDKNKMKVEDEVGLVNFIKHIGSIDSTINQFQASFCSSEQHIM